MLQFLKRENFTIVRYALFSIGCALFGLMITFPLELIDEKYQFKNGIIIAASCLATLTYCLIIYYVSNEYGQSDKIKRDAGRSDVKIYYYTVAAALAKAPSIILATLACVGKLCISGVGFFEFIDNVQGVPYINGVEIELLPSWAASMFSLCGVVARFVSGMFLGLESSTSLRNTPLSLFIIPVLAIAVCTAGYAVGVRRGTLFPFGNMTGHKPKKEKL